MHEVSILLVRVLYRRSDSCYLDFKDALGTGHAARGYDFLSAGAVFTTVPRPSGTRVGVVTAGSAKIRNLKCWSDVLLRSDAHELGVDALINKSEETKLDLQKIFPPMHSPLLLAYHLIQPLNLELNVGDDNDPCQSAHVWYCVEQW